MARIVRMNVTLNVIPADIGPSTRDNVYSARGEVFRPKGGASDDAGVWNVSYRSGGADGWA